MKKRYVCLTAVAGAMLGILLSGCGKSDAARFIGENDYNIDGAYDMAIPFGSEAKSTVLGLNFDRENAAYTETITLGGEVYVMFEGIYLVDEDTETVTCIPEKGSAQSFVIAGTYLIADGFFFDGEIPDGETFDATCTYENGEGDVTTVTFFKDGTYTDTGGATETSGTYKRGGDFISRSAEDGTPLVDFIIYKNRISNAFYMKK